MNIAKNYYFKWLGGFWQEGESVKHIDKQDHRNTVMKKLSHQIKLGIKFMVLNTTFNNISVIF